MNAVIETPNSGLDATIRHWLLNLVIETPVRLVRLFPQVACESLNVKEIRGCRPEDYAENLIKLFESGLIKFVSEVPGDDVRSSSGVSRIIDRFLRIPRENENLVKPTQRYGMPGMQVSFRLTSPGGEAWEMTAEPEWTRFVSSTTTYAATDPQTEAVGDLISPNLDLLVAYLGWYPEIRGEQIKMETIQWQTRTDYEVLYWKRLPFVYRASFQTMPAEKRWHGYKEPQWFWDWWVSSCSWYKKPWDLPNWPSG